MKDSCMCVHSLATPGLPCVYMVSGRVGFDNAMQLSAIDVWLSLRSVVCLPCSNITIPSLTHSLSNQFSNGALQCMCLCVWAHVAECTSTCQFLNNTTECSHKSQITAADRLMRSMCTGNHRCCWKHVIHAERASDVNEGREKCRCLLRHAGWIHWLCNCSHRSQTQHIFVMSFVSPAPCVTGTPSWCRAECPAEWWRSVYPCMGYLSPSAVWCWIKEALRQTVCQMW